MSSTARLGGATRRGFLAGVAGTAAVAAAGLAAAQQGFDGWFDDVSNYDGVVDRTGQSEVTVTVGAEGNGGAFAYGPAAVRVDPGTTVTWEWSGEGSPHNVVADDGSYESELVGDEGHTFSHAFGSEGVSKYYCTPHEGMGMKGAVVVGEAATGGGGGDGGSSADGSTASGESPLARYGTLGLAGVLIAALLGLPAAAMRSD
jgi:halocyanin-like protein